MLLYFCLILVIKQFGFFYKIEIFLRSKGFTPESPINNCYFSIVPQKWKLSQNVRFSRIFSIIFQSFNNNNNNAYIWKFSWNFMALPNSKILFPPAINGRPKLLLPCSTHKILHIIRSSRFVRSIYSPHQMFPRRLFVI